MSKVGVVISQYNLGDLTKKCVDSVLNSTICHPASHYPCEVVVIDDGSEIPYVDDRVKIIRYDTPHGNTHSMNAGIMHFINDCDYIYNLDNDTEVEPYAIEALMKTMDANPNIALAGSIRIQTINGRTVRLGESADLIRGMASNVPETAETKGCLWVAGCSVMLRSSVIREIGMFNKRLINYCGDAEWCLRAIINHYDVVIVPKSVVKHVGQITMHTYNVKIAPDWAEYYSILSCERMRLILKTLPLDAVTRECGRLKYDTFIEPTTT